MCFTINDNNKAKNKRKLLHLLQQQPNKISIMESRIEPKYVQWILVITLTGNFVIMIIVLDSQNTKPFLL